MSNTDMMVPNPESARAALTPTEVTIPSPEGQSFKAKATWTENGKHQTGFLSAYPGGALAYQWYARTDADDRHAPVLTEHPAGDGTSYMSFVDTDGNRHYLSQVAAPRLWLYFTKFEPYATRWKRDASGRLLSAYDDLKPVYRCINNPTRFSDYYGYLCTGVEGDNNYSILRLDFIS